MGQPEDGGVWVASPPPAADPGAGGCTGASDPLQSGDRDGQKKIIDDDDDIPVPLGRPRAPEQFGPPKPEPHQRKEFVTRLQSILDALELSDLGRDERMYLQRILWRTDLLCSFDPKRFTIRSADRVILLLRSIAETTNGAELLTLPIMRAVFLPPP